MSVSSYLIPFVVAFGLSVVLTFIVRRVARRTRLYDDAVQAPDRKQQTVPVPLGGGVALYLAFTIVVMGYAFFSDRLLGGYLLPKHIVGLLIAGALLVIGGLLDDRSRLSPGKQIVWPFLASLVIVASGIGIDYITNPFGGTLPLDQWTTTLFTWDNVPYQLVLMADLFTVLWLLGLAYTTKFLDGLDGLVAGITTIGSVIVFAVSIKSDVGQPETGLLALILAGAAAGFLVFNFNPASVYLGEGGSLFTGFALGVLAILSGGKIATALLIMGIPILDVVWVIVRRAFREKRSPFGPGDRGHLHFRLLSAGFSHRGAVLVLYLLSALFGASTLFTSGLGKLMVLVALGLVMVSLATVLIVRTRRQTPTP